MTILVTLVLIVSDVIILVNVTVLHLILFLESFTPFSRLNPYSLVISLCYDIELFRFSVLLLHITLVRRGQIMISGLFFLIEQAARRPETCVSIGSMRRPGLLFVFKKLRLCHVT